MSSRRAAGRRDCRAPRQCHRIAQMSEETVLRRAAPQPEHEGDDRQPDADDEPPLHAREHREGNAVIVGSVEGEHRHDRHPLLEGQIRLHQIFDELVGGERDQNEERDRERPREKCLLLPHRPPSRDRRWRRASNSMMPVAMARLSESARPPAECGRVRRPRARVPPAGPPVHCPSEARPASICSRSCDSRRNPPDGSRPPERRPLSASG